MKNKIILFLSVCIMAIGSAVMAQSQLVLEATQQLTTFKFMDSQGNSLNKDYNGILTGAYALGYRYSLNSGILFQGKIGMRNAGATMVYDDMNYSWKLQYGYLALGAGYKFGQKKISPYAIVSGYFGYLLRGTQLLNNEEFNITDAGLLNSTDYGIMGNAGVIFKLSDYVSAYTEFSYLMGLCNIESDAGQDAMNTAYGLTLGISFSITDK
ncbi:MAG: hypothetical protein AB7V36_12380 [Bacteroidales bacterium]